MSNVSQHAENAIGHVQFALEVGLETERGKAWLVMGQIDAQLAVAAEQKRIADWLEAWPLAHDGSPVTSPNAVY